jgi:hypothetical protein
MSQQTPPSKFPEGRRGRRRRVRRVVRVSVVCLGGIGLLVAVGLWLVTRSWFIIARVTPELEQMLGGQIVIADASYEGGGRFVFHDCVLLAPDLPEGADEVVRIKEIDVVVDLEQLLRGRLQLEDVRLVRAQFRLSEDAHDTSAFNFMNLRPNWSDEDEWSLPMPPRVRIIDAQIEYGTHDENGYDLQGARYVGGELDPIPDADGWYDFSLIETNGMSGTLPGGIHIYGKWNAKTHEHQGLINGIKLDRRTYDMCPQVARVWWESMDLEGTVARLVLHWQPDEPFAVEMVVEDVGLTLPIETDEFWSRYRGGIVEPTVGRPRMQVNSGTIRLERNRLDLHDLAGQFVSSQDRDAVVQVPYRVNVSVKSLPDLDWEHKEEWMAQVLDLAPFEMDFAIEEYRVSDDQKPSPVVELPTVVARALEKFDMTSWTLSTRVKIMRDAPFKDASGTLQPRPVETDGTAYVRDGAGAFERFPYRLENIEAYLRFDTDLITVHSLDGYGTSGTPVSIAGTIGRPASEGAVDLRITAEGAPLDARFYDALQDIERRAYDALLHQQSYDALVASGVISDPRAGVETDAPPFELGGTIDLDLYLKRPHGVDASFALGGTIDIHDAGILYEGFPYPIQIDYGRLLWDDRSMTIDDENGGMAVETLGGGSGRVTGDIQWNDDDGSWRMLPDIQLSIEHDSISEVLWAAIPPTRIEPEHEDLVDEELEDWPGSRRSRVARLLDAAGLGGELDYTGQITRRDTGDIGYDFDVRLHDGVAIPSPNIEEVMGGAELLWSAGIELADVTGHLIVTNDQIELLEFSGRHDEAQLHATGLIDLRPEIVDTRIEVKVENLSLGKYLIDLAKVDGIERALGLWDQYQPAGRFDAQLEYHSGAGGPDPTRFKVQLRQLQVMLDDAPVLVDCTGGSLSISDGTVQIDGLVVNLQDRGRHDGKLTLNGIYETKGDEPALRLEGSWDGGQLGSPLITEVLSLFGDDVGVSQKYEEMKPTGEFNAEFLFVSGTGDRPETYEFAIRPSAIAMSMNETPIYVQMDGEGEIVLQPGSIRLQNLHGTHVGGSFHLDGLILSDETISAELQLSYDGSLLSHQFQAFMPDSLSDALAKIRLQEGGPSRVDHARIRLEQLAVGDPPSEWRSSLSGNVYLQGASMDTGVEITDVSGVIQVDGARNPGALPILFMHCQLDSLEAYGHRVTRVEVPILLGTQGDSIEIPALRGEVGGGAIHAQIEAGLGERADYDVAIEIVGASLDEFFADLADETAVNDIEASPDKEGRNPTGHLYATLHLAGERGDSQTRSGRGTIRLMGGRVVDVPLVMQIVQLLQFTVPFTGAIDYVDADYFINGDRMVLEQILLESTFGNNATLQLLGEGNLNLKTFEIDTRFHTRSGVALVRELFGTLGDVLYAIQVVGPIRNPKARVIALPKQQGAPTSSPPVQRTATIKLGQGQ